MGRAIVIGSVLFPAPLLFPLATGPTPVVAAIAAAGAMLGVLWLLAPPISSVRDASSVAVSEAA